MLQPLPKDVLDVIDHAPPQELEEVGERREGGLQHRHIFVEVAKRSYNDLQSSREIRIEVALQVTNELYH